MSERALDDDAVPQQLRELDAALDTVHALILGEDHSSTLIQELQTAYEELRVAAEELRVQRDDIDQLRRGQLALRQQQERTMAGLPVPVLVTGPHGAIRWANAAATTLSHSRLERLVGKPVLTLFEVEARRELRRLIAAEHPDGFSTTLRTSLQRDGEVEVSVSSSVVAGLEPQLTWMVLANDQIPAGAFSSRDLPLVLARLTSLAAAGGNDLVTVLDAAAGLAKGILGPEVALTVTYGSPEKPTILSSTDALAQEIDGLQLQTGEGPCVDAFATGQTLISEHLRTDPRWPTLAAATPQSVGAVVAIPLRASGRVVGALNVYCATAGTDPGRVLTAEVIATTIGAVLQEQTLQAELHASAQDLSRALESRAVIDQAKGMIMADRGCTADEAFAHLGRLSSQNGLKLRQVAQQIVERRGRSV